MSVANADVVRVTINATLADGVKVMNRKTFQALFAATQTDAAVLAAIKSWVETLYAYVASYIDQAAALTQGTADIIAWNPTDTRWEVTQNVGVYNPLDTFSSINEQLPNQCTAFVVGNTLRPKSKGRLFLFPFDEATQDQGILTSAVLTALGNFATQYITAAVIDGSNQLASVIVRETVNALYGLDSVDYDDIIGTQRRRRPGVGQ